MKFEIQLPVAPLKQAAAGLGKAMMRTSLPVLHSVRIARDESGQVTLQTTDLESFACCRLAEMPPGDKGALLVPWDAFSKAIKSSQNIVAFRLEDEQLIVRSFVRSIAFEEAFEAVPEKDWPKVPVCGAETQIVDASLKIAIQQALECASSDPNRPIHGACLYLSEQGHYVVGTDGKHLFSANSFRFDLRRSIILPPRRFLAWAGFMADGDWTLSLSEMEEADVPRWVELRSANWTFTTRLIDGEYPEWRQVVPGSNGNTRIALPPEALATLAEAAPRLPTGSGPNPAILLRCQGGRFSVRGPAATGVPVNEVTVPEAQVAGRDVTIALSRENVSKALRFGLDRIEIHDTLAPVVFSSGGKLLVTMPMRREENNAPPAAAPETITPAPEPPSAGQDQPTTDTDNSTTNTMNANTSSLTATARATRTLGGATNGANSTPASTAATEETPFKAALNHLETLRAGLRNLQNEVNQSMTLLRAAEREQKAAEREIESVRSTLRSLKKVEI